MRPLRFLLLLTLFVVLPVILTCVSLFSTKNTNPEKVDLGYQTRSGRFRALFSFSTPSSLFPPSAIISLTDDNTTSFLARPAAFGPSLPSNGLSGQLWVGKGFGEDIYQLDIDIRFSGFELGCSDVPGWNDDHKMRPENGAIDGKPTKSKVDDSTNKKEASSKSKPSKRDEQFSDEDHPSKPQDDGTDDYLHHPLPDSNPASPEKPGEPASVDNQDKTKPPTHADIESLQESADIAGKIVMLSRGGCGFLEKIKWAQRRGGVAVIVGDNEPGGQLIVMYAKGDTSNVTIPAIFTSYYSAHLLSTLVPPEQKLEVGGDGRLVQPKDGKTKLKEITSDKKLPIGKRPKLVKGKTDGQSDPKTEKGWVQNVLSVVGLEDDAAARNEDSRRPPGSGNIDWVLLEDWDEDKPVTSSAAAQAQKAVKTASLSTKAVKAQVTPSKKVDDDDFIIGVQDWRDTELIAPKSTASQGSNKQKGRVDPAATPVSASSSSINPTATALKGGSIIPGSGEYDHKTDEANQRDKQGKNSNSRISGERVHREDHQSLGEKIASLFYGDRTEIVHPRPDERSSRPNSEAQKDTSNDKTTKLKHGEGLWVTLTPASTSTSPFFDTLLVLVVSPLITLTFVYGLLLLRSRIRRRRWRAPKSIVERLPVRTYHTMANYSSTTSSTLTSPNPSSQNSPTLRPSNHNRVRPRSQTTTGVLSSSPPAEKPSTKSSPKRKRYMGRQLECVVCLEDYVDGESQVMSLPCGHEFHVECITPWLVTRRRTCPICKGDVVRSLARNNGDTSSTFVDVRLADEQTSDDIQDQAAMTRNQDSSAAIPIPAVEEGALDNDIERGSTIETPLLGSTPRVQQNRWRGIFNGSFSRLSGDTVWRSSTSSIHDRNR